MPLAGIPYHADAFDKKNARETLIRHFGVMTLEGMGCEALPLAISSSGAALLYAKTTQMRDLAHIQSVRTYFENEFMVLDSITLRNLEIIRRMRGGNSSLLSILDSTKTPMGRRLLQKMLLKPFIGVGIITERLDAADELVKKTLLRFDLRSLFATHYHQLTAVEGILKRVKNYHIAVKEEAGVVVELNLKQIPKILRITSNLYELKRTPAA
jgi:DNA mismatch repair protein MutS